MHAKTYHFVGPHSPNTAPTQHGTQYTQQQIEVEQDSAPQSANESNREHNLIYCLRGLPYSTTEADLVAFLAPVPAYHRVDMGRLASGECSGLAFVELATDAYKQQIENLHHKEFMCAANNALDPDKRPRPRFADVIQTTAEEREAQLNADRVLNRNQLTANRQARSQVEGGATTAATVVAGTSAASAAGASASTSSTQPLAHPQQAGLQDSQHQCSSFSRLLSPQQPQPPHPPPQQQQAANPSYFLISASPPMQRSRVPTSTSSFVEVVNSFSSSPHSTTHLSTQSSPRFGEPGQSLPSHSPLTNVASVITQPPTQQQQQQQGYMPYNVQSSLSHPYQPQRPFQ